MLGSRNIRYHYPDGVCISKSAGVGAIAAVFFLTSEHDFKGGMVDQHSINSPILFFSFGTYPGRFDDQMLWNL